MNIIEWTVELRFAVALALGFLVGLEREGLRSSQRILLIGGVRTFPIISLFGFGCAWLHGHGATFMLPVGLFSLTALAAISYVTKIREAEQYGITTEVSALLTFIIGALALVADIWIAMALGIVNTFLLSEKAKLESSVKKLDKVEFLAVIKFLLVTLIILPALPDRGYTRFNLNPSEIWRMVILVASVGFLGYLLSKKLGDRAGLWLGGLVGGVVSSTAVTVASGRIARQDPARSTGALQAALLAGSVMYLRILVILAVVKPGLVPMIWWRLGGLALFGVILALSVRRVESPDQASQGFSLQNPFEIRPAVLFAALFTALSIITVLATEALGRAGLYVVSGVAGLADIDPFILSVAQSSELAVPLALSAMLAAMMANTLAKGVYFSALASSMRKQAAWRYGLWILAHVPLILIR